MIFLLQIHFICMKTIEFKSQNEHQTAFAAELKKNVHAYFKANNLSMKATWRFYTKAIVMLSFYIGSFVLLLTTSIPVWVSILLVLIMGIGEAGIGMSIMHDGAHGSVSKKDWVNKLFASTIVLLGSNAINWKIQHNMLHHRYTNIYGFDQDILTKGIIRLSDHAPLKPYHRYQFIYAFFLYGLMTLSKLVADFKQLFLFNKEGIMEEQRIKLRKELVKLIVIKSIYLMIIVGLPLFVTDFKWWQILIGFSIMHITAGIIMSAIFQMAHVVIGAQQPLPDENNIIQNEWHVHQLCVTVDFAPNNKLLSWYAGGLNFQIEHHLFQYICHIHFKAIAPIIKRTAQKYGYDYQVNSSFSKAIKSHIKRLKDLGRMKP
jgi:linoleoyl-CoA desaturase